MMILTTSALLVSLATLAIAQSPPLNETAYGGFPTGGNALTYYRASRASNTTNSVAIPGFNWSAFLGDGGSGYSFSSDTWQFNLNYSKVILPTSSGNATTGLTALSMTFPGQQWASNSSWQLCASTVLNGVPDSIASSAANNSNSSCVPYFGQSCVNALVTAYERQSTPRTGSGCPSLPSLANIEECRSVVNAYLGPVPGNAITNTTSPDLVFNSTQFVNVTGSGPTYFRSNVTYQGLSSRQAFISDLTVFPGPNIDAQSIAESKKLYVIGLSMVPSLQYRLNSNGGYGWGPNVRLICMRANATTSGSTSGGTSGGTSDATSLRRLPILMVVAVMVLTSLAIS